MTGLKAGKTTVNIKHGGKTYKCTVTVQANKPSNIKINTASVSLSWKKTQKVSLVGGDESVEWSIGNVNVAEFAGSNKGASVTIRGQIAGKTTLKAVYKGKTYSVPVKVTEAPGIDKEKAYKKLAEDVKLDTEFYRKGDYTRYSSATRGFEVVITPVPRADIDIRDMRCIPVTKGLKVVPAYDGSLDRWLAYHCYSNVRGIAYFKVYYKGREVGYGPGILFVGPEDELYDSCDNTPVDEVGTYENNEWRKYR